MSHQLRFKHLHHKGTKDTKNFHALSSGCILPPRLAEPEQHLIAFLCDLCAFVVQILSLGLGFFVPLWCECAF